MMKLTHILIILSLIGVAACSNNKKKNETAAAEKKQETFEDTDFIVDSSDEDLLIEDSSVKEKAQEEVAILETKAQEETEIMLDSATQTADVPEYKNEVMISSAGEYTVQKGDTLMLIAFKVYGDYRKWKDIAGMNPSLNVSHLKAGTVLKYNEPAQKFEWNPEGLPHLIKRGETLGIISTDKYGTSKHWKSIWKNNQPLIIDPNLIFAGFTIYYLPKRDIASEQ